MSRAFKSEHSLSGAGASNVDESSVVNDATDAPQAEDPPKKISKHLVTPGVSKPIFRALKKKIYQMTEKDRLCVLLFQEIDIDPHLNYLSREDYIIGFEDFGWKRTQKFADTATVFMLRSIYGKWKQPVAFAFYDCPLTVDAIARYYKEIVKNTTDAGLNIVASVCIHATLNMKAMDKLMEETRKASTDDVAANAIIINGHSVVPIFDPPILLTSIRNRMLAKDLSFKKDETSKVAKWAHLREAYEIDRDMSIGYLKKITENHVAPEKIRRTNISHCAQTFSRTMASFLNMVAGKISDSSPKTLPVEANETAELVAFLDRIFDSVNGGMGNSSADKPLRGLVTDKSQHQKVWLEGKEMFAQMKFIKEDPQDATAAFTAWCRTLEGFIVIKKNLSNLGFNTFPARAMNLDPLENCFDLMLAWGKAGKDLTCKQFSRFYNAALSLSELPAHHSSNFSCEKDDLSFLVKTEDFAHWYND